MHDGRSLAGIYRHPEGSQSHFTGTLSGDRNIRLVLDDGTIEVYGHGGRSTSHLRCGPYPAMELKVRGGSADGLVLPFHLFYSGC